jgi:MOSC domain-containing protein YiiM
VTSTQRSISYTITIIVFINSYTDEYSIAQKAPQLRINEPNMVLYSQIRKRIEEYMAESQTSAYLASINVNPQGGVPKHAVEQASITTEKVIGDKQRNRKHHGGPDRAVSLYSYDLIQTLQAEGHPITPGSTGENFTIAGLDWSSIAVGDRLKVGAVELEITGYAKPCSNIIASFAQGHITRVSESVNPGWSRLYARVLQEGDVHVNDPVEHISQAESVKNP